MLNDSDLYNPSGAAVADIWDYDPAGSPRQIPPANRIGSMDLIQTRIEGAPGNAERLAKMFSRSLRYCHERRKWLVFWGTEPCWRWDDSGGHALAMAAETIHELYRQARRLGEEKLEKAALRLLYVRELRETLVAAQETLRVPLSALDSNPDLLACRNGVLDLVTGELNDRFTPELFLTRAVDVDYDPLATAPTFLGFVRDAMGGDHRSIAAIQSFLGYAVTGRVSSKAVFLAVGPGDTGKSTLLGCIYQLLGEYAAKISVESIMKGAEHSNNALADLAVLRGARFCVTSEVDSGHRLNVSRLKALCQGGELPIKAALKYENPMEFRESHKLFIDTNYRPAVPSDDQALFNRLICIPFDHVVPPERQDRKLSEKLHAEFPGILAWLAQGARRWYGSGGDLPRPPAIAAAGAAYRSAMDLVVRFVEDCCVTGDAAWERKPTNSTVLYRAFENWARSQHAALSQKKFSQELMARTGLKPRKIDDSMYWDGISLI